MALRHDVFTSSIVTIASPLGELALGVVDPRAAGVAEGISRLLMRSIQDARASTGGHLPEWLVDDIERNYISPEKIRTLWAPTGHRFAVLLDGEIVSTVHIAIAHETILTVDRHRINVAAADYPGFKPPGAHHVVNLSVKHELRRAGLATRMFDGIAAGFRSLFDGDAFWVRADPPWHAGLLGLGFVHDPALDVFLPESVERTAGLAHAVFNERYACSCPGAAEASRSEATAKKKLQYVSFRRAFDRRTSRRAHVGASDGGVSGQPLRVLGREPKEVRPASIEELASTLARASEERRTVEIRGGAFSRPPSRAHDLIVTTTRLDRIVGIESDAVTAEGGVTWRTLLAGLPPGLYPPVIPGWIDATVGGTLATGGIGKGASGYALDHVRSLVVITLDGRRVRCTRTEAAWLYEAVLAGHGVFGVIAELTIPLVRRSSHVTVSQRLVPAGELARALAEPAPSFHALAVAEDGAWRVIQARECEQGDLGATPTAAFVAPPKRAEAGPVAQYLLPGPNVAAFVAGLATERAIHVHVVEQRRPRAGLLLPTVEGNQAYVVTLGAEPQARSLTELAEHAKALGGTTTLQGSPPEDERALRVWLGLGARWDAAVRAKALADPAGVLGGRALMFP